MNELETYYRAITDLTDNKKSYNLVEAYKMKCALDYIEKMETDLKTIKTKIAENLSRTIGEYNDAEITESDGVKIAIVKIGRASLNEKEAWEKYPEICKESQTVTKTFDINTFSVENPVEYKKYLVDLKNLTLTDLRNSKKLTEAEIESVIIRGPSTYTVKLVEGI